MHCSAKNRQRKSEQSEHSLSASHWDFIQSTTLKKCIEKCPLFSRTSIIFFSLFMSFSRLFPQQAELYLSCANGIYCHMALSGIDLEKCIRFYCYCRDCIIVIINMRTSINCWLSLRWQFLRMALRQKKKSKH